MAIRISSVAAILFGALLLSTGQGLHQALIPISAESFGFSALVLSALASVYFGGYLAGCILAPALIKRVGHSRTLAIAASTLSIASLAHILLPQEAMWVLVRVIVGFCFANIDVVFESWLAARAEGRDRGKLLSVYRLVDLAALAVGQILISLAGPTEFTLFAFVAIFVCLAVIVVSASTEAAPSVPQRVRIRPRYIRCSMPSLVITDT